MSDWDPALATPVDKAGKPLPPWNPEEAVPVRGPLSEIATAGKRGLYEAVSGLGATLQAPAEMARVEPGVVSRVGRSLEEFGKAGAEANTPQPEAHGPITNFLSQVAGTGSALPMVGAGIAGAAAAPFAPPVGAAAGVGGQVALQTWHEKYQEARGKGVPDEEARSIANESAALQGTLMAGAGGAGAVIARGGSIAAKALGREAPTASEAMTGALTKRFPPEAVKSVAELTGINVGLGLAGAGGQAAIDAAHRAPGETGPTPLEAAAASIVPSLAASVAFSPLALLGARGAVKHAEYVKKVLTDPTAAPDIRAAAADHLADAIAPVDENASVLWRQNAQQAIAAKQPVGLTPDWAAQPFPTPAERAGVQATQGPLQAAVAPAIDAGQTPVTQPAMPFRSEEAAQRAADFTTQQTGVEHAVVKEGASFFSRPAPTPEDQARETQLTEARTVGEKLKQEDVKAAQSAAEDATVPLKDGGERIGKADAREHIAALDSLIADFQGQATQLRESAKTNPGDTEFADRIEKTIESTRANQVKIARRAQLPQEEIDAIAKPSTAPVGAQPVGGEGVGRTGEGRGVGGGDQGAAASAGQEEARRPGEETQVTLASHPPDVKGAAEGVPADQIDRTTAPAEPTPAQAIAGNYAKDHIAVGDLDLAIENRVGTQRSDKEHTPPEWTSEIKDADYGYIKGTQGLDKGHVDAFVKPGTAKDWNGTVFVVDQLDQKTGKLDEHKALIGYDSKDEAVAAYKANYPADFKVGPVGEAPLAVFDQWVKSKQTAKAFAEREPVPIERKVSITAIEQETGREAEVSLPAHEAIAHLHDSIQRAKDLLACLSS